MTVRRPPDATAERMLVLAIPLFARSGFDGVSMRNWLSSWRKGA